jgi:hypothetical protein
VWLVTWRVLQAFDVIECLGEYLSLAEALRILYGDSGFPDVA